jgi:Prokaryotic dksA/traR C4-type zinc finger
MMGKFHFTSALRTAISQRPTREALSQAVMNAPRRTAGLSTLLLFDQPPSAIKAGKAGSHCCAGVFHAFRDEIRKGFTANERHRRKGEPEENYYSSGSSDARAGRTWSAARWTRHDPHRPGWRRSGRQDGGCRRVRGDRDECRLIEHRWPVHTVLDETLDRFRLGLYGVCEECGAEISLERLRVVPFASRCIDCQRQRECRRGKAINMRRPPRTRLSS